MSPREAEKPRQHDDDLMILSSVAQATAGFVIIRLTLGLFGMDLYEIYWWFAPAWPFLWPGLWSEPTEGHGFLSSNGPVCKTDKGSQHERGWPAKPEISVIVPLYNEELVIGEMYSQLTRIMQQTGLTYEIVMVNDGSRDKTPEMAREICAADRNVKLIDFSRNFGHQFAITAACGPKLRPGRSW